MNRHMTKARTARDQGFTLIELLVVIVIMGILVGIAFPVFMNHRKKGVDASLRSDLKSLALAAETYATENVGDTYYGTSATPTDASVSAALGLNSAVAFKRSPGNVVQIKGSPLDGYCIRARNDNGTMGSSNLYFHFDSKNGGLLPSGPAASVAGGACGVTTGALGTWYTVT